ncbi:hypothetical protein J5754_04250 [bacterium]|nr:hypothetical protein [bacterium]
MNIHTLDIVPRHSEVDINGKVKLRAVFDYIQEAAAQHAELLGCGMRFLAKEKKIWVLSRMRLHFNRPLLLGEKLTVFTYPRGFDKLFALRPLVIKDENGEEVMQALSLWLLLDMERGRILRPMENLACPMPDNSEFPGYFDTPDKPSASIENLKEIFTSTTRDAQIDLNRHMNNAEYALYTHSAIAELTKTAPYFEDLTVNFSKATKSGEKLIWRAKVNDDRTFAVIASDESGAERFQASGTLAL